MSRLLLRPRCVASSGPTIIQPNAVSGLISWIEFDDISTLFKSADATTTAVTTTGDVIRTMRDKAHASNLWWKNRTSDATSPVYTENGGKKFGAFTIAASRFLSYYAGGVADTTIDSLTRPAAYTFICAYRKAASGSAARILGSSANSTVGCFDGTDNLMYGSAVSNAAKPNASSTFIRTSFGVGAWVNVDDTVANYQFYQDNVLLAGANQTSSATTATVFNAMGRQSSSYSDCDIIGWALYNAVLSASDRAGVTAYFQAKC
jgi:hypothetical protein